MMTERVAAALKRDPLPWLLRLKRSGIILSIGLFPMAVGPNAPAEQVIRWLR